MKRIRLTPLVMLFLGYGLTGCCFLGFVGNCKNGADYCCLRYERGQPRSSYCNNHSGAVGIYMEMLDSDSIRAVWFADFQRFLEGVEYCADPKCIEDSIRSATELSDFISFYVSEHDDAESTLVRHPEVTLSPIDKAALIRCGFTDAIERTQANQEQE
jgi:hypothetical protein